ncbi:MAG: response regulator, partial [Leptothrix sp. (in: b-proteobacteria)]
TMTAVRVLLADDHRMVREALRDMLAKVDGIEVVGEAGDAAGALAQARALVPDVIVLDISLPDLDGIEVASRLQRAGNAARIVALSGHADKHHVSAMLRAGAAAYLTKSTAGTELVRAIRAVVAGQSYFCPEVAHALAAEIRERAQPGDAPRLGRREREVLRLIAAGQRSPAIAEQLHIAVSTVEVHRRNIMRKLGLGNVADLTKYAIREGLASV